MPARKSVRPEVRHGRAPARDGVSIAYTLWRRPSRELIVLAPGFWRVRLARENLYLAEHFWRLGYDVAALDFRGHGDSGGGYGFGASEDRDFIAVVEELAGPDGSTRASRWSASRSAGRSPRMRSPPGRTSPAALS